MIEVAEANSIQGGCPLEFSLPVEYDHQARSRNTGSSSV